MHNVLGIRHILIHESEVLYIKFVIFITPASCLLLQCLQEGLRDSLTFMGKVFYNLVPVLEGFF